MEFERREDSKIQDPKALLCKWYIEKLEAGQEKPYDQSNPMNALTKECTIPWDQKMCLVGDLED